MLQLLIFSTAALLYYQIYLLLTKNKRRLKNRIYKYTSDTATSLEEEKSSTKTSKEKSLLPGLKNMGKLLNRSNRVEGVIQKLDKKILKSGLPLKGEELLLIMILSSFIIGFIFYFLFSLAPFFVVGLFFGGFIPLTYINIKIKKRRQVFENQIGEVLNTMANSLRAGHSFFKAVEVVSKESSAPASEEFTRLSKEIQLGLSTEDALANMGDRVESSDLNMVITAVLIQRQVGGDLAEVLDNISGTVRDRLRIKDEIKTLTAQGKLSGIIVSLLPFGLAAIFYVMNPDYIMLLFKEPIGLLLVALGLIGQIIGAIFIKKIVEIDF